MYMVFTLSLSIPLVRRPIFLFKINENIVINVMKIARELGHENLVKYLRNPLNGPEYMNFILRGKTR